jgi:hypothetical protein
MFKVFSHRRSGTHFLLETLDLNFNKKVVWWNSKSHAFFNNQRIPKDSIYLVRDGRDVMVSAYHYWRVGGEPRSEIHGTMKRYPTSFSQFLRGKLNTEFIPEVWLPYVQDPIGYWVRHTEWENHIYTVHYEDLVADPEKVMVEISFAFGVPLKKPPIKYMPERITELVGIFPRKGVVGEWKSHFSDNDLIFFLKKAGQRMKELGYTNLFKDRAQMQRILEKELMK